MEYLSVKEIAELKGCSERYVKKTIQDGKLEAEQTVNEKNRPKYLIPITALPEELRSKYYKQKRTELGLMPELKDSKAELKEQSKAVKKPIKQKRLDEFTEDERSQIALWCSILKEWQIIRSKYKNKTEVDPLFCSKVKLEYPAIDVSVDILYRKYKAYINNDLDGLVDHRGGWNKGNCSIEPEVLSIFTSYYLTTKKLRAYLKTQKSCII